MVPVTKDSAHRGAGRPSPRLQRTRCHGGIRATRRAGRRRGAADAGDAGTGRARQRLGQGQAQGQVGRQDGRPRAAQRAPRLAARNGRRVLGGPHARPRRRRVILARRRQAARHLSLVAACTLHYARLWLPRGPSSSRGPQADSRARRMQVAKAGLPPPRPAVRRARHPPRAPSTAAETKPGPRHPAPPAHHRGHGCCRRTASACSTRAPRRPPRPHASARAPQARRRAAVLSARPARWRWRASARRRRSSSAAACGAVCAPVAARAARSRVSARRWRRAAPRARAAPLTTACAAAPLGVGACKARQGPNFACVFHTTMLLRRAQPACAGSRGRRAHQSSAAQAGRPPEVVACATMDSISSTVCIDVGTPRCTRRSLSSRLPGARLVRNLRAHAARRRALDAHSRGSRRARARSLRAGRYATGGAHQGCRMISGMVIRRFGSGVSMLRSSARQSSLTRRGCS